MGYNTYNLLVNGVCWGYNPLTNPLLTSWDIQVMDCQKGVHLSAKIRFDDFAKATSEFTDSSVTVSYLEIYNEESGGALNGVFWGFFCCKKTSETAPFVLVEKKTERAHFEPLILKFFFDLILIYTYYL